MNLFTGIASPQRLEAVLRIATRNTIRQGTLYESKRKSSTLCFRCQLQSVSYNTASSVISRRKPAPRSPTDRNTRRIPSWTTLPPARRPFASSSTSSAPGPPASPDQTNDAGKAAAEDLPSVTESQRSPVSKRLTSLLDALQSNLFVASKRLNDLTGYTPIEALKGAITTQETELTNNRQRVRLAKASYQDAISRRSTSQREVNALLQRKDAWSPTDLERFTSLYRNDHANEQAEAAAQAELTKAESEAEKNSEELGTNILRRYHEEQVWSDKIRRMSTWGTWGLMGVNVLLFFIFQVGVEPWRRRRLVSGFEEKVRQAMEQGQAASAGVAAKDNAAASTDTSLSPQYSTPISPDGTADLTSTTSTPSLPTTSVPASLSQEPPTPPISPSSHPSSPLQSTLEIGKNRLQDLFSERTITLSRFDLTTIALESAATGAAVMGALCFVLLRRS